MRDSHQHSLRGEIDRARFFTCLRPDRNSLGSAADADVVVAVSGLSHWHAVIEIEGRVEVIDNGSTIGAPLGLGG